MLWQKNRRPQAPGSASRSSTPCPKDVQEVPAHHHRGTAPRMTSRSWLRAVKRSAPRIDTNRSSTSGTRSWATAMTITPPLGRHHQFRPTIARVGNSRHEPVGLQMPHQFRHRLFRHLRALCEHCDCCSVVVEVLEHRSVCRSNVVVAPLGEPHEDQIVQRDEHFSHQHGEVGGGGAGRKSSEFGLTSTSVLLNLRIWTSYLSILAHCVVWTWEPTRSRCWPVAPKPAARCSRWTCGCSLVAAHR